MSFPRVLLSVPSARLALAFLLGGWLLGGAATSARAELLLGYDFSNFDVAPTYQATGITGSDFARDSNFNGTTFDTATVNGTVGSPAPAASSPEWTSTAFDPNLYYTFTLTSSAPVRLLGLSFDLQSPTAGGPTNFAVRSSADGFAANLAAGTLTASFARQTVALNALAAAGQPFEFRIYGFGASDSGAVLNLDNVNVVPEPGTAVTLLVASGLFVGYWRRYRSVRA